MDTDSTTKKGRISKIFKYGLALTALFLVFIMISLASTYQSFLRTYKLGLSGKSELTAAALDLKNKSWEGALEKSDLANKNFNKALDELLIIRDNFLIKKSSVLRSQVNDLEYLLKTTEIISRSLNRVAGLAGEFYHLSSGSSGENLIALPEKEKIDLLKLIYESEPELNGLKANLNIALLNIEKINKIGILWPIYGEISEYHEQLASVLETIDNLGPLSRLLLALGGYPQDSRLLLIFQNNDELRPSGGFIGSFGLVTIKNGNIYNLETKDSYHLDMPAVGKWQLEPPPAIKKYLGVENWYFRDSNWSPDWPRAARQIQEIYLGESLAIGQASEQFSAIIAINPDFIADLITLVDDITIDGETYTSENFQTLLQYAVEVSYKEKDISSWDRKNIINDLVAELKERLFKLSISQWPELIRIINQNIAYKNIQIYFNDANLKSVVDNLGAGGEIKSVEHDYLMVVDANLAAFKSDAVVKKSISYDLYQKNNQVNASLFLNYQHEGGFDWRTTRYRSYTRVYLPLGSRFISSSGLDDKTANWSVQDDIDLNKTILSFFFTVEPGTTKELIFHYTLPEKINNQINTGGYELLIQKQSGRRTNVLNFNFYPESGNFKKWSTNLNTDRYFKL